MFYGYTHKAPNYALLVAQYNMKITNKGHPELAIFFNKDDIVDELVDHKWDERIGKHYNSRDRFCMYDPRDHKIISGQTVKEMYDYIGAKSQYIGEPF